MLNNILGPAQREPEFCWVFLTVFVSVWVVVERGELIAEAAAQVAAARVRVEYVEDCACDAQVLSEELEQRLEQVKSELELAEHVHAALASTSF